MYNMAGTGEFMIKLAGAVFLAIGLSITTAKAGAAFCGERNKMVNVLKNKFSEERMAAALSQSGITAFEFFVSSKGTWTVLMTTADGTTCIVASGHSWKSYAPGEPA